MMVMTMVMRKETLTKQLVDSRRSTSSRDKGRGGRENLQECMHTYEG